jgi:hypothetical protein
MRPRGGRGLSSFRRLLAGITSQLPPDLRVPVLSSIHLGVDRIAQVGPYLKALRRSALFPIT